MPARQRRPGHLGIVKRLHVVAKILPRLVALPGNEHYVAGQRHGKGATYGLAPVGIYQRGRPGDATGNFLNDGQGVARCGGCPR